MATEYFVQLLTHLKLPYVPLSSHVADLQERQM
jgi:hypothetical protein